ncbi:hypothetical protein SAMN05421856_103150 [Chryseobacterium taichungense]|uniref:Uncharacterized protein n=1 Tax=Chryseobacterium taichungense TaxID=295069 RepID=A0A1H7Y8K2_9FLAO|nr:hypothetical protein SAMN05421856_103150 [Chryseobacterium taichungense]
MIMRGEFDYISNRFIKENISKVFKQEDIKEIRLIRVLRGYKLKYLENKSPFRLLLFSNDDLYFINETTAEDCISFYTFKIHKDIYIMGLRTIYYDNGTRKEDVVYNKQIPSFLYHLLISKYNTVL